MGRLGVLVMLTVLSLGLGCPDEPTVAPPPISTPTEVSPPLTATPACNPISQDWGHCLLPFPSDVWTLTDATLPGGRKVLLSDDGIPRDVLDTPLNPLPYVPWDGFALLPQIMVRLPDGVADKDLIAHDQQAERTLDPLLTKTLLLRADTGEPVLHWAETEPPGKDGVRRVLHIRPLVRLAPGRQYIVALKGLETPAGALISPPSAFAAIQAGTATGALADHYEAHIFGPLESVGWARGDVQLAWDFTTGTEEHLMKDLLAIREQAIASLAATPATVELLEVIDHPDGNLARTLRLAIEGPLYLDIPGPGGRLLRDADGRPRASTQRARFEADLHLPRSVFERPPGSAPEPLVQYGHGFFGTRAEAGTAAKDFGQSAGLAVVGTDWWGMTEDDVIIVLEDIAGRPDQLIRFSDRVHQSMVNQMVLTQVMRGPVRDLVETWTAAGEPSWDGEQVVFYGNSQGSILGGTFAAFTPSITRFALGVGGAGLGMMMGRSQAFEAFHLIIQARLGFGDAAPASLPLVFSLAGMALERIDPVLWAPEVISPTLPNTPPARQILMMIGIGDASVPNLGSHVHARALGLKQLTPKPRAVVGLADIASPVELGSALVEFDFGIAKPHPGDLPEVPDKGNDVHEAVRRLAVAHTMMAAFMRTGVITNPCDGPCDPE